MSLEKNGMIYAHSNGHTDVCFSADGKYLMTCGSDGDMRIWLGITDADPQSTGIDNSAYALASHGDKVYCGNSSVSVLELTLPRGDRNGIITRFSAPCSHLDVSADGKILVSGSCDMNIHVTNTSSYANVILSGHKGPILGVALDPKGDYVVSSSGEGSVWLWKIETEAVVKKWEALFPYSNDFFTASVLGRASWLPESGRLLAVPTLKKVMIISRGSWDTLIELDNPEVSSHFSLTRFSPCGRLLAATSKDGKISVWDTALHQLTLTESYDRPLPFSGLAWNPSRELRDQGRAEIALVDSHGHLGTVVVKLPSTTAESVNGDAEETVRRDLAMDDLDDDKLSDFDAASVRSPTNADDVGSVVREVQVYKDDPDKYQPPFQPSSTPESLQRRFMVWNDVGIVQAFTDTEEHTIDVEFHDTTVHHSFSVNNFLEHTMASLTRDVLVLSGEGQEDAGSKVVCVMLQSRDGSREWSVQLPEEEETVALAAGESFVAVATDLRVLRLFSLAGSQRDMLSLPGRTVCMAAQGDKLLVVYHGAAGIGDDQCLWYLGLRVTRFLTRLQDRPQPLPLSPNSKLEWCGFSDEGRPLTFDSVGVLRAFTSLGWWQPICDTQLLPKRKTDNYFIIGVCEASQQMRCVLCKGTHYPHTSPRPTLLEVEFQAPVCELHTDKGREEGKMLPLKEVCTLLDLPDTGISDVSESALKANLRAMNQAALKIFAMACKQDLERRATELYTMLPSTQVRELARKYAANIGKETLAERLCDLEPEIETSWQSLKSEMQNPQSCIVERPYYPPRYANGYSRYDEDEPQGARRNGSAHREDREMEGGEEEESPVSLLVNPRRGRASSSSSLCSPDLGVSPGSSANPFKRRVSGAGAAKLAPLPMHKVAAARAQRASSTAASSPLTPTEPSKKGSLQTTLKGFSRTPPISSTSSSPCEATPELPRPASSQEGEDADLIVESSQATPVNISRQEVEMDSPMDEPDSSEVPATPETPSSSVAVRTASPAPSSTSANGSSPATPTMQFKQWFDQNEAQLKSQFPDLEQPALIKAAVKLFKHKNKQERAASPSTPAAPGDKREAEVTVNGDVKRAKTSSKLQGFAFKKN